MDILHCTADYDNIYYVEYGGALHECKFLGTKSGGISPVYVLDIAGVGITEINVTALNIINSCRSMIRGILYRSIDDFRNDSPIIDEYGSTSNQNDAMFIRPLFSKCTPNDYGDTYTWKWDGTKAVRYSVNIDSYSWSWDSLGFHCALNSAIDCYASKEECEKANSNNINVVRFQDYKEEY